MLSVMKWHNSLQKFGNAILYFLVFPPESVIQRKILESLYLNSVENLKRIGWIWLCDYECTAIQTPYSNPSNKKDSQISW